MTTVIIPTAGTGSRMGNYTKHLNKALLPYKDRPILSHIIDKFPEDTKFLIPVGHLGQQVRDFCAVAYHDKNITFVQIEDWVSDKSGTGVTLKQCKNHVKESFWFVSCDTYFDEPVLEHTEDCYYVKAVPEHISSLYTMFNIVNNRITDITFKQTQLDPWMAFTGLMYIHNWDKFFTALENYKGIEYIPIIEKGSQISLLDTWLDFGSAEQYQTALSKSQKFDFTKKDEVTYICNNRVVKWWLDANTAKKKFNKTQANPTVFPKNCTYKNNFLAYEFFQGQTLYEFNNPVAFTDYLQWLKNEVWFKTDINLKTQCLEFYKTKTLSRINKFLEKYPYLEPVNYIDGIKVKDYSYYLENIDWDYLCTEVCPGFIHGDLHFDNTVINSAGEFKVIDWRHEFADVVEYGDIYYDLAKLSGGFIINYANIKEHNFSIEIDNHAVTLGVPSVDHLDIYQRKLKEFILANGFDYKKVQTLVPIIFWNMSPLHTAPFDLFLWYLGIKLFEENSK